MSSLYAAFYCQEKPRSARLRESYLGDREQLKVRGKWVSEKGSFNNVKTDLDFSLRWRL